MEKSPSHKTRSSGKKFPPGSHRVKEDRGTSEPSNSSQSNSAQSESSHPVQSTGNLNEPQSNPEINHPPKKIRFSVLLAGFVLGLLIVYLIFTFAYVQEKPKQAEKLSPHLSSVISEPKEEPPAPKLETLSHTFSFQEVFEQLRSMDKMQKTDFRKESLRKNILPLSQIVNIQAELKRLRADLNRSLINNETVFWVHLAEGRHEQLESERYLQLAMAYGRRGLFSKNITESCGRRQDILDAALLYNQSARHGGRAMYHFDETLTQEKTWPLLGINDKRMEFYGGDTRDIGYLAYSLTEAVRTRCMGLSTGDAPEMMKALDKAENKTGSA